jgi:beta-glucosidase-like glycosyl hydrolase
MIQFYDYSLETYLNATLDLINNGSVALATLQSHVSRILGVKYDLGLFENRYIPETVNSQTLTDAHLPLTLEAAHKSIVLLENRYWTLPIRPAAQNISKIALVGPFSDALNYVSFQLRVSLSP